VILDDIVEEEGTPWWLFLGALVLAATPAVAEQAMREWRASRRRAREKDQILMVLAAQAGMKVDDDDDEEGESS
jgi:hypothetical protein